MSEAQTATAADVTSFAKAMVLGEIGSGWHQVTSELAFERSGPERFLSTYPLLAALVGELGRYGGVDRGARREVGALVTRLWALRRAAMRGRFDGRMRLSGVRVENWGDGRLDAGHVRLAGATVVSMSVRHFGDTFWPMVRMVDSSAAMSASPVRMLPSSCLA